MKIQKLLILALLIGIFLSACSPVSLAQNTPTATLPTPTTASSQTDTPAASQPPAVNTAQQDLARQLGVAIDMVKVVSVEKVQWRNGCLGIEMPGKMCTQVITPGYKVTLEAGGKQYEYHTNETGSAAFPAVAALPKTADKVVVWEQSEGTACSRAEIGSQSVAYGQCGGQLKETALEAARVEELNYLLVTYASFSRETKAGTIQFNGSGQKPPTEAEMRSIAEWARLVNMEAQGGRGGAAWGLAFSWHREGGIAGFCDDLAVYLTGWALPGSCKNSQPQKNQAYRLSPDELKQLYAWVDQMANIDYEHKDAAVADAMLIRLSFIGTGSQKALPAQQEEIAAFAGQIYANAKNR